MIVCDRARRKKRKDSGSGVVLDCISILSFFLIILARSNYDHYARECDFGILKEKNKNKNKKKKKKKKKKSFGCVFY